MQTIDILSAALTRDSHTAYSLTNISAFVQDSFTRGMELLGKYTLFAEGARGTIFALGEMEADVVDGFWGDAGESIEAYYEVNDFVRRNGVNA